MGVMEKMRASTSIILWILIISFGFLWMLADTQVFDSMMRGPRSLGEVNGEKIEIEEYNQRIQYYTRQYQQQNDAPLDAEQRAYFEDQAWNELVASKIMQRKMNELGIQVTDTELINMITGEDPDPMIKKQFQTEDGTIDRVALRKAIESPKNKKVWIMIERQLRQKRRQQKMSTFVRAALRVSNHEIEQQYIKQNSTADFAYVRFPYAEVSREDISVSEDELRSYYNNHQDKYHRDKSWRFKYVSFDITPTKQDTQRVLKELRGLRQDFAEAEDDSSFLNRHQSDASYSPTTVERSELKDVFRPVINIEEGEVTEVFREDDRFHILKKLGETGNTIRFVKLTRNVTADPIATVDKALENADDFSYFAQQNQFAEEAKRRDLEIQEAFATKGNNFIAGIGQSRQIMSFLKSSSTGNISKPIELDDQIVVVKVNKVVPAGPRPFEEVQSQIKNTVINRKRQNKVYDRVSALSSEHKSPTEIANAAGKEVQHVDDLELDASVIEDAGREERIIGAVFGLNNGEVSKPLEGNNAVFVVKVEEKNMADPKNMVSSARQSIAKELQKEKVSTYMKVWMDELKENAEIVDHRDQVLR